MFAAGVPLVEALDSVGGASGNFSLLHRRQKKFSRKYLTGTSLTVAMDNAKIFPSMVIQMCAIGEESGFIDHMLGKAADFYEAEVDEMVAGLSSLMEPIIIVFLGSLIGGISSLHVPPHFQIGAGGLMDFAVLPAAGLAGLLGLLIGSFLNVVIYRLPKMMERQWAAEITAYQAEKENTPSRTEEASPRKRPSIRLTGSSVGVSSMRASGRWYENIPSRQLPVSAR